MNLAELLDKPKYTTNQINFFAKELRLFPHEVQAIVQSGLDLWLNQPIPQHFNDDSYVKVYIVATNHSTNGFTGTAHHNDTDVTSEVVRLITCLRQQTLNRE